MLKQVQVELLTMTGARFRGAAGEVSLATASGAIGILPHHEPLTAVIVPGPVVIHPVSGADESFAIFGGLLEVTPEVVRILADEAEHSSELVQSEIEAALAEAQHLKASASTTHELHHAESLIDRHQVRLEVVRIRRRHHKNHNR
jgi:F-type H+-transporting ATPase subunit epsilon